MGFWSKLGKIASVAAPIVAAPFTGGASLALIGAGSGAAGGLLNGGGWKGALTGGALGAIPGVGGIGKAGASGLKAGLAQAGKGLLTNPNVIGGVTGALASGMEKGRGQENVAASNAADFKMQEASLAEQALMNRSKLDLDQRDFGIASQNNAYQNAMRSALAKNLKDVSVSGRPTKMTFSGGLRPSAIGAEGLAAADLMYGKSMDALKSGEKFAALPAIERTGAPEFKKPGFWENALGIVGAGSKAVGGAQDMQRQDQFQANILEEIKKLAQGQGNGGGGDTSGGYTF